ncbi:MAG: isopeptide-forming domain-containing fimbrial protein, partial [Clostridia bacterium]|nr:isopeptide-forming domain-containing fimbrial protein [Clostridia bacterium]
LNQVVNEELDRTKLDEIEKYVVLGEPYTKITVEGNDPASVDLPAGYYLIRDVPDSQTGEYDAYTTYITVVVNNYTIKPKSEIPSVDKEVSETANDWRETADHAINEPFQFKLTAKIPQNKHLVDYETYKLVFTDTMSDGVTFDGIASVTREDGSKLEYDCTATVGQKGGQWKLTINNIIPNEGSIENGETITVIYNAHLNENAVVSTTSENSTTATNNNCVELEYSNNPNTSYSGNLGKTIPDHVWVFTYRVDNTKYANVQETGHELAYAGFTLYSDSTPIKLINQGNGQYVVANQSDESGVVTEMMSGSDGKFKIKGLDAGTYTLHETTTPSGYNSCPDVTVTINATHNENEGDESASLDLSKSSNMVNDIVNHSGHSLPSTGGPGTAMLYAVGAALTLLTTLLLGLRRRWEK